MAFNVTNLQQGAEVATIAPNQQIVQETLVDETINFDPIVNTLAEFKRGRVEERQQAAVRELRENVSFLNDGAAAETLLPGGENERVDITSNQFRRLALGLKQGKVSRDNVLIEGEKILRESIRQAPFFEGEFRKLAAELIGVDPTGSEARVVLGLSGNSSSNKLAGMTKFEKDKLNAQQWSGFILREEDRVVSWQTIMSRQRLAEDTEQRKSTAANRVAINDITFSEGLSEMAFNDQDLFTNIQIKVAAFAKEQGGTIDDPRFWTRSLDVVIQEWVDTVETRVRADQEETGFVWTTAHTKETEEFITLRTKRIRDAINDTGTFKFLTDRAALTEIGYKVLGQELLPGLGIVRSQGGDRAAQVWMESLRQASSLAELKLLGTIPGFAALFQVAGSEEFNKNFADAASNLLTGKILPAHQQAYANGVGKILYEAAGDDGKTKAEIAAALTKTTGGIYPSLSLMNKPGEAQKADEAQVDEMSSMWDLGMAPKNGRNQEKRAINAALDFTKGGILELPEGTDFKFFIDSKGKISAATFISGIIAQTTPTVQITAEVRRLNAWVEGSDNGWSAVYDVNPKTFSHDIVARLNAGIASIKPKASQKRWDPKTQSMVPTRK